MSLATAFKKMHPLQRRQIANILGWIAALLMFAHFYINTRGCLQLSVIH